MRFTSVLVAVVVLLGCGAAEKEAYTVHLIGASGDTLRTWECITDYYVGDGDLDVWTDNMAETIRLVPGQSVKRVRCQ